MKNIPFKSNVHTKQDCIFNGRIFSIFFFTFRVIKTILIKKYNKTAHLKYTEFKF